MIGLRCEAKVIGGRKLIPRERLVGTRDSFPVRRSRAMLAGALCLLRLSTADRVPDAPFDPIVFPVFPDARSHFSARELFQRITSEKLMSVSLKSCELQMKSVNFRPMGAALRSDSVMNWRRIAHDIDFTPADRVLQTTNAKYRRLLIDPY